MLRIWVRVAYIAAVVVWARSAGAQALSKIEYDRSEVPLTSSGPCVPRLSAASVVACALARSPEVRQSRGRLDVIAGRRLSAGIWLPGNPVAAAATARRRRVDSLPGDPTSAINWSVTLSQEIQIAGQRGARLDVVDAEAAAQVRRVAAAEQEVAAVALAAYFEAVAAAEGLFVASALAQTAAALAGLAEAQATEQILPGVDADVARSEATRITLGRFEAERRKELAVQSLALLLGIEPEALALGTALDPPGGDIDLADTKSLEGNALRLRGEVGAAEMERRVLERELVLLRRERIPNPTVSAFVAREEFNDHVIGFGVSVPIALPAPIGKTLAGEIAETIARIRVSESSGEMVRRRVRREVRGAAVNASSRQRAAALFSPALLARARADLAALREGISSRQLSLREALLAQRSLMELVQADVEVRLQRALAIVELRRAAGLPFPMTTGESR